MNTIFRLKAQFTEYSACPVAEKAGNNLTPARRRVLLQKIFFLVIIINAAFIIQTAVNDYHHGLELKYSNIECEYGPWEEGECFVDASGAYTSNFTRAVIKRYLKPCDMLIKPSTQCQDCLYSYSIQPCIDNKQWVFITYFYY